MTVNPMMTKRLSIAVLVAALTPALAGPSSAQSIDGASAAQLRQWLKEYPQADADRDGVLTIEEAKAYYQELRRKQLQKRAPNETFRHEFCFATMSDGVKIALAVSYPRDFDPADRQRKWPTLLAMYGYPSSTRPTDPARFGQHYVVIRASVRGTGASDGQLDAWRQRTAQDGYEVIENWIVKQPWSNGKVGIWGCSWPGDQGILTATTQPPSLKAVCVSGLIDDLYRGISYIGGVRNCGFPIGWCNNYYVADGPFGSASAASARGLDKAAYRAIVNARPPRDLTRDILWFVLHEPFDGPGWREQSPCTYAPRIRAPIFIAHAWQDQETGPTGWLLWKRIPDDVPKRLTLSNGKHCTWPDGDTEQNRWFAHWLLDEGQDEPFDPDTRVACYFETDKRPGRRPAEPLRARDFPLPQTQWTRYYLRNGYRLLPSQADQDEPTGSYQVVYGAPSGREHRAIYSLEFPETTAVCGPAVLTLWAQLATLDTDFYVLVGDLAPDGRLYGLQRGLLRASHRALDQQRSDYVDCDGRKELIQPYHPHTSVEPVTPHEPTKFQIGIPAFGHVFRPGHKLALVIMQPLEGDPIGVTASGARSYRYDSHSPPGTVTILQDAAHPSRLLLPVLPELPPLPDPAVPLDQQAGIQPVKELSAD